MGWGHILWAEAVPPGQIGNFNYPIVEASTVEILPLSSNNENMANHAAETALPPLGRAIARRLPTESNVNAEERDNDDSMEVDDDDNMEMGEEFAAETGIVIDNTMKAEDEE